METAGHIAGLSAPGRKAEDLAVTDDLAGMPVADAELDAIEAFLGAALRDLFAKDSEPPQTHADVALSRQGRGAGQ